jgi:hypothetical protein
LHFYIFFSRRFAKPLPDTYAGWNLTGEGSVGAKWNPEPQIPPTALEPRMCGDK